jgi:dethiobiotin synthetase
MKQLPGLLVTGTDTGVGKTRVTAAIARVLTDSGHGVGVCKPLATGARLEHGTWTSDDALALRQAIRRDVPLDRITPLTFAEPLAPSVAARRAGAYLTLDHVVAATRAALSAWSEEADLLLVEGVGGFFCPIADRATVADLAVALDFPVLIVARRALGTLNHTLMTITLARQLGLRIAGIVLNTPEPGADDLAASTNAEELVRWLEREPILLELPHLDSLEAAAHACSCLDWADRATVPRLG